VAKKVTVEIMTITPSKAAEILKRSEDFINRPLSETEVSYLTKEMKEGRFVLNGESIILGQDGKLLDGKRRLTAIVKSGLPQEIVVSKNVPRKAVPTMDMGRPRTIAEILSMMGEKQAKYLTPIARRYYFWIKKYVTPSRKADKIAPQVLDEVIVKNQDIREAAEYASKKTVGTVCSPTLAGFAYFLCKRIEKDEAEKFFQKLETGMNITEGEPVGVLREKLITDKVSTRKYDDSSKLAFIIKAWNLTREGKETDRIRWTRNMPFPEPK